MKKFITLLSVVILTISCSKNDDNLKSPEVPAGANFELKGLFNINSSLSANPQNFLFENNKLFVGNDSGSISQTLKLGGNLLIDSVPYSYNATTNKLTFTYLTKKWECTYEATTGKIINGIVKQADGTTVAGTFTGQKYIPAVDGANLFIGHWKGFKNSDNNQVAPVPYSLIIENGTVVLVRDSPNTLDNNFIPDYGFSIVAPVYENTTITVFSQTNAGILVSFKATYNPVTKKLQGTWGNGFDVTGGGTVVFDSQNMN